MSYSVADIDTYERLPDHTRRAIEALARGGYLPTSEDCWCADSAHADQDAAEEAGAERVREDVLSVCRPVALLAERVPDVAEDREYRQLCRDLAAWFPSQWARRDG